MKKASISTSDLASLPPRQSAAQSAPQAAPKPCAHAGCREEGLYPAPHNRDNLRDYIWFCLEHVRAYNRQWNYFAFMTRAEINQSIDDATTWERPSWVFGAGVGAGAGAGTGAKFQPNLHDAFGFFTQTQTPEHYISPEERRAWKALELNELNELNKRNARTPINPPADIWDAIKKQYKMLVKKHHPDTNGGDAKAEEKIKTITCAFAVLERIYCPSRCPGRCPGRCPNQ